MNDSNATQAQVCDTLAEMAKGLAPLAVVSVVALLMAALSACSPTPARNRVTPGHAAIEREIQQPSRWRIEIRQPPRIYVPTEAETEGDGK